MLGRLKRSLSHPDSKQVRIRWEKSHHQLVLMQGDILQQSVDALMVCAKPSLRIGHGRYACVHRQAGPKLKEATQNRGPLAVGEVFMTPGFDLPARHLLHAVGPVLKQPWGTSRRHPTSKQRQDGAGATDALLFRTYMSALQCAEDAGCQSIALPCLGSGSRICPPSRTAPIAIRALTLFFADARRLREVRLVVPDDASFDAFAGAARARDRAVLSMSVPHGPGPIAPSARKEQLPAAVGADPSTSVDLAIEIGPLATVEPPGATPDNAIAKALGAPQQTFAPSPERIVAMAKLHTHFHALDTIGALQYLAPAGQGDETLFLLDVDETLVRHPPHSHVFAKPMEACTAEALHELQSSSPCVGLTSRSYASAWLCWFELQMCNIGLEPKEGWPSLHLATASGNAGYLGGVVFASEHTRKGDFLNRITAQYPRVKNVVFLDDQVINFCGMVLANAERPEPLNLHCVHYTRMPKASQRDSVLCAASEEHHERFIEAVQSGNAPQMLAMCDADRASRRHTPGPDPDDAAHAYVTDLLQLNLARTHIDIKQRVRDFLADVSALPIGHELQSTVRFIADQYARSR